jgi:purine-binding chemotaxis protein CheW
MLEPSADPSDEVIAPSIGITEQQCEAIFARRAEALAAVITPPRPTDAFEALVFALGSERYAFRSGHVSEIRQVGDLTALPSAPRFVAGLINVRGRIVPVLDLRPLLGMTAADSPQAVVLLQVPHGEVALLTTDQPSLRWLRSSQLAGLPIGRPGELDTACVQGISPDSVIVLDAPRLLADPRLVVQEEVSVG